LLHDLANRVRASCRIAVLTGAGVSAASGVPTFRGPEGLWRNYRPEDLASADAFRRDPRTVWEWYDWRRQVIARCQPNAGHLVLAAWARRLPGCTVITQNVDGLHERAGLAEVLRLHGSIWQLTCWHRCGGAPDGWRDETVPLRELPPRCPHCGGLARPGVIWFGEMLPMAVLASARRAAETCDLFILAGTSALVSPAADLVRNATGHGAFTVEINPTETVASDGVDLILRGRAEMVLARVEGELAQGTSTAAP
jgi:NAD-dependent deacetylase